MTLTSNCDAASAQPIRVLLVGPSLDILGGQSVQLARLLAGFHDTADVQVDFLPVNPRLRGPLGVFQRIKYVRTAATSVYYLASLLRRVRSYDVIHAFSASYYAYLLAPLPALAVGKLYGRRTILNYHSGQADDHLTNWPSAGSTMRRFADSIVVPSEYLVDVFAKHGLCARAIANFVDVERLRYRDRDVPRAIFFSNRNFEPLYNVRCTLDAFAIVQSEVPHASLVLAGDGTQRGMLEAHVHTLGLRNVTFVGRIAPERMGEAYDAADVYLNSPDIDNMPLSVIEAFAAGLPVVTTNAGGIPFIVRNEETGLVVPASNPSALAAAALRILREPGLAQRLSSEARAECLRLYVWGAVKADWRALYCDRDRAQSQPTT